MLTARVECNINDAARTYIFNDIPDRRAKSTVKRRLTRMANVGMDSIHVVLVKGVYMRTDRNPRTVLHMEALCKCVACGSTEDLGEWDCFWPRNFMCDKCKINDLRWCMRQPEGTRIALGLSNQPYPGYGPATLLAALRAQEVD